MQNGRNLALYILAFGAFTALCYFGAPILLTVILAIITAYMLDPMVNLLRRIRFPKVLAIGISMAMAAVLVGALLVLFVDRAQQFSDNLPRYRSRIEKFTSNLTKHVLAWQRRSSDLSKTILPKPPGGTTKPLVVRQEPQWTDFFGENIQMFLIQVSFFPFLVYFLLTDKEQIRTAVARIIRGKSSLETVVVQDAASRIVNDVNEKVRGFIVGYLLSTTILFAFAWILFLFFQVEAALIWAVLFALLNMIPFVGAFLAAAPPLMIGILQFTSFQKTLLLTGICLLYHVIYANWLIPKTAGRRTALSPLMVLLSMMYWGFLWGAIGFFLAIPLTASLRTVWIHYKAFEERKQRDEVNAALRPDFS